MIVLLASIVILASPSGNAEYAVSEPCAILARHAAICYTAGTPNPLVAYSLKSGQDPLEWQEVATW